MSKVPINVQELISTGTTFQVDPSQDFSDNESEEEYKHEVVNYVNMNCVGQFEDEDVFDSTEPFESLASKMTTLTNDDGIKKRVLREGYGNKPEEKCIVRIHFNAYTEFNEEPFDSTYARKKPHQFVLGSGNVIPGLDIAVSSMNLNEKSQFLIKPFYAYGSMGCMERVPPNSTVLFEVELLEIVESAASTDYENLPEEKKREFAVVYKYCMAQSAKGKDLFKRNIKSAIKEYNRAVRPMENVVLEEYDEQVKQQEFLFKLYSNLLVCYTKDGEPKKACINFNKLSSLTKGTDLKITAKAYYNNAKSLRMLGDFGLAKRRLQLAYQLEPKNPDILTEFKIIDEEQRKYKEKELKVAKAFMK